MTDLKFVQDRSNSDPDNPWLGMKTYQLTPWPERVEITYYDIGSNVKIGQTTVFNWANGRAEYRVVSDKNGLGCDFECELLPGSTWQEPPPEVLRK